MFTCRDDKGGVLSSQASKMLYKPPGAFYIASYKEPARPIRLLETLCSTPKIILIVDSFDYKVKVR